MGDEISEEQLLEFCQRLGLARNGYLDEKDLSVVCKCIGVDVPVEKIKELFEELDTDKDGKICLSELSQMFRGMQNKMSSTPERNVKSNDSQGTVESTGKSNGYFPLQLVENGTFAVLDPDNTGFTEVGCILDLWSQLGISHDNGLNILNDMGFQACSRSNSVNVQLLTKSIEDELDHFNEVGIPLTTQIALLTYRTETQYLRSLCEGVETERDKLKQDMFEAHQRSSLLAQEIDEQNTRLEKTNQALIQKLEFKYNEQINEMQKRFALEKECLQQAIQSLESQQTLSRDEETRLRVQVVNLTQENANLELEVQIINQDVRNVNRLKEQLEREVSRSVDLENRLIEMEKKHSGNIETRENELLKAYSDVQTLRDQNDELSVRLESMREALHSMKTSEEKRYFVKRRKGIFQSSNAAHFSEKGSVSDESHGVPLEKVGKYNQHIDVDMFDPTFVDEEETEVFADTSLPNIYSQPDLRNCRLSSVINLVACMGESSTDHCVPPDILEPIKLTKSTTITEAEMNLYPHYNSLENEMDSVKQKIVTVLTDKKQLLKKNNLLKILQNNSSLISSRCTLDTMVASTQTSLNELPESHEIIEFSGGVRIPENLCTESYISQISELELKLQSNKVISAKERQSHQIQCANLENSLELLQLEYEKCEEYWHGKLQEARDEYDLDKNSSDEKFYELAFKIQEYEDMFLKQTDLLPGKLPPIAECATLEKQVNELEEECQLLRDGLVSMKISHETAIGSLQRKCEAKALEKCGNLEQEVLVLSQKCHEYESRLSTLAEEERSNLEDTGMLQILKDTVSRLEFQLKEQDDRNRAHLKHLDSVWKEKEHNLKGSPHSVLPTGEICAHNKSLLDMLRQSKLDTNFSQKSTGYSVKSASLPYFSAEELTFQTNGCGSTPTFTQDVWSSDAPTNSKKAWCHVELGWLQTLRSKLKERDEQCFILQRVLHQKEFQTEKLVTDLKGQHAFEVSNWENLMKANQELNRQHAVKYREQAEKLVHADLLLRDLWVENAKLMAALNTTEQRVIQLENLLKFQLNAKGNNANGSTNTTECTQNSLPSTQHQCNNN